MVRKSVFPVIKSDGMLILVKKFISICVCLSYNDETNKQKARSEKKEPETHLDTKIFLFLKLFSNGVNVT